MVLYSIVRASALDYFIVVRRRKNVGVREVQISVRKLAVNSSV